jgi:predicted nucleic acid-binding protein
VTDVVIDASIALAWCFRDERTEATAKLLERVQTDAVAVPVLWHLRVAKCSRWLSAADALPQRRAQN